MENVNEDLEIFIKSEELIDRLYQWQLDVLPDFLEMEEKNLDFLAQLLFFLGYHGTAVIAPVRFSDNPEMVNIKMKGQRLFSFGEKIVIGYTDLKGEKVPIIHLLKKQKMYEVETMFKEDDGTLFFDLSLLTIRDFN